VISFTFISRKGSRKNNEDCVDVFYQDGKYLFALADGLGGHSSGDIASSLVISKAIEVYKSAQNEDCLAECFTEAQSALMDEQLQRNIDMKTTLVLLSLNNGRADWGHIGDSRLYIFDSGKLISRTNDHSVPQMLVHTGELREKDIRFHPDRNRLLRVMGTEWDSPRYEISSNQVSTQGMSYLLCTDGFWELINEKEMCRYLHHAKSTDEWLADMERKVIKNGKGKNMDNYSAIGVWR